MGAALPGYWARIGAFITAIVVAQLGQAAPTPQDLSLICDQAAAYAATQTGVPLSVLQAISLNETGRRRNGRMRPWPWTVNMEGKGVWFDNEDAARAYVYKNYKRGARSFDVGCFQINYKWHGQAFASIEEMFSPRPNALYAAKFLLELFREKGTWKGAAGAYHSRTPKYANRYEKRFEAYRMALGGSATPQLSIPLAVAQAAAATPASPPKARVNRYPLLQAGGTRGSLGSLVPLSAAALGKRLIDIGARDG